MTYFWFRFGFKMLEQKKKSKNFGNRMVAKRWMLKIILKSKLNCNFFYKI